MENNSPQIEKLLERIKEYGKTTVELAKLQTIDKTSDILSSVLPRAVIFSLVTVCLLFVNLGFALWLGEILGRIYWGFFVIGSFWALIGGIIYLFLFNRIKLIVRNAIIKQVLN